MIELSEIIHSLTPLYGGETGLFCMRRRMGHLVLYGNSNEVIIFEEKTIYNNSDFSRFYLLMLIGRAV